MTVSLRRLKKKTDWSGDMIQYTTEQLESFEFYLIGDDDREDYYPAIIGIAKDRNHILQF